MPQKKSIIDRAVRKVYQPLVDNDYNGEMPTLKDFVQCMLCQKTL